MISRDEFWRVYLEKLKEKKTKEIEAVGHEIWDMGSHRPSWDPDAIVDSIKSGLTIDGIERFLTTGPVVPGPTMRETLQYFGFPETYEAIIEIMKGWQHP